MFFNGDTVVPVTLSIQGSDSSKQFVGKPGKVIDSKTSTNGVKVEFEHPFVGSGSSRFVYYPASLRIVGSESWDSLESRLVEARKDVSALEFALAERSRINQEILAAYDGICKLTEGLPKPAREEIMQRLGDISTIPVRSEP